MCLLLSGQRYLGDSNFQLKKRFTLHAFRLTIKLSIFNFQFSTKKRFTKKNSLIKRLFFNLIKQSCGLFFIALELFSFSSFLPLGTASFYKFLASFFHFIQSCSLLIGIKGFNFPTFFFFKLLEHIF